MKFTKDPFVFGITLTKTRDPRRKQQARIAQWNQPPVKVPEVLYQIGIDPQDE